MNGVAVHQHPLNPGDRIRIGETLMTYLPSDESTLRSLLLTRAWALGFSSTTSFTSETLDSILLTWPQTNKILTCTASLKFDMLVWPCSP